MKYVLALFTSVGILLVAGALFGIANEIEHSSRSSFAVGLILKNLIIFGGCFGIIGAWKAITRNK